ncbi:hypothetical protein [Clostridium thermarum]|nr:hypothetical protein [Clostridium thermarum]
MVTLMFVAIWGFISLNQMLGQMKYNNYLLEKLTQNVHMLAAKDSAETCISNSSQEKEKNTELSKYKK